MGVVHCTHLRIIFVAAHFREFNVAIQTTSSDDCRLALDLLAGSRQMLRKEDENVDETLLILKKG